MQIVKVKVRGRKTDPGRSYEFHYPGNADEFCEFIRTEFPDHECITEQIDDKIPEENHLPDNETQTG
jgi:hypothetical protein